MSAMERKILFGCIFWQFLLFANTKSFYTLVAPEILKAGAEYSATVTLHYNTEPSIVKVGIYGPSFNSTKTLDLGTFNIAEAKFNVPALEKGTYKLKVQGVKGMIFGNVTELKCDYETNVMDDMKQMIDAKSQVPKNVTTKRMGLLNFKKDQNRRIAADISLDINSNETIPYLVYALVVKGQIRSHQYLEVEGNATTEYVNLSPTAEMLPHIDLYVYYIKNNELISTDIRLFFMPRPKDLSENDTKPSFPEGAEEKMSHDVCNKTKPGEISGLITLTNALPSRKRVAAVSVNANGYYTVVAPGTIQSDYAYDVTVTVHEHHVPATIKVSITGPSFNESQIVEVNPTSAKVVHFDVPTLAEGDYELQTEGLSGLIFKQHAKLNYKSELPKVYIQTDKAQYKPGDLVKYRILALNENLGPAKQTQSLMLHIQDGASNKIKQIKDLKFEKGVHAGQFQLSEQPVLGEWKLEVTMGKFRKSKASKHFDVAKYVLPKFSVQLEADKKVAILDRVVKITVRSKYTYGKPVKGTVKVLASFDNNFARQYQGPIGPSIAYAPSPGFNPPAGILGTAKFARSSSRSSSPSSRTTSSRTSSSRTTYPRPSASPHPRSTRSRSTLSPHSPEIKKVGAEKTIDFDGKAEVELDIMEDLKIEHYRGYGLPKVYVMAVVTEAFTGLEQNATTSIQIEKSRYTITVPKMAKSYEINKPFEITAVIKKLNGLPVTNARSTAKLILSQQGGYSPSYGGPGYASGPPGYGPPGYSHPQYPGYGGGYGQNNELMYESEVDKNGMAKFNLKLTTQVSYSSIKIMYEEKTESFPGFNAHAKITEIPTTSSMGSPMPGFGEYVGPLKLFPKTRDPKLNEEIVIDVKSQDVIPYIVYTVMVRGKILKHEYVKVEENKKCVCIKIKPTFEMAPVAKVFVYLVRDGELKYDETTINIPNKFENTLEITADEQAKPSDMVTLNIKTDPDSYVGLLGVDQSVLLLQTGNDLDEEAIFNDLGSYDSHSQWGPYYNSRPGRNSGFVTLTNACHPREEYGNYPSVAYASPGMASGGAPFGVQPGSMQQSASARPYAGPGMAVGMAGPLMRPSAPIQPKIRKDFVESWIFDSVESTDAQGYANFTKKIPDTITSWVITGFSLNENTGFAKTQNTTKIRVFQPFFLSTNLPYSIKRGEVISVPIIVFNYMEDELDAEITMENIDREYDFTEAFSDDTEVAYDDTQRTKHIRVPANTGETVSFTIRPNIVGEITLRIKAITPIAGDAIHQKLKVEPEGVTKYENEAYFVTLPQGEPISHTLIAKIPSDVVLDSEYMEFSVVGDLLGPTIKNIDQLVRMPYGCGEQNMVNFVPNILVLHYLDIIKADMPTVTEKAKSYMEKGYQRELTYKHKNGAYSAFGEGHSKANSWLTAYVVKSFIQARKYITISHDVIHEALTYLISTQKPDGQFPQTGKLFHSTNQNEVGVSAYIMLAFLEDTDYALKYQAQIEKGLEYLLANVEREDDVYTLSLVALVYQKLKNPILSRVVEKLEYKSNYENNLKWWGKSSGSYNTNKIEITAYVLQTLVEFEEPSNILPIIKWLIGQRNSLGGFDSTQDTVVGLQALIKFAEKFAAGGSGQMSIAFESQSNDGLTTTSSSFQVDRENALILQSHVLHKSTRQLYLTATGQGSALVQLSYHYNMASENDQPSFLIKHELRPSSYDGQLIMNVCAEYKPQVTSEDPVNNESNMAVMEIFLPSGFTTHDDSLMPIRDVPQVQRVETKNSDTAIIVYFESLVAGQPICFNVMAERAHAVAKLKPAAITVYDYYNTDQRATVYYKVESSLCDICEEDECGKGCKLK